MTAKAIMEIIRERELRAKTAQHLVDLMVRGDLPNMGDVTYYEFMQRVLNPVEIPDEVGV
jgi:hypothetical protein